jgi:2-polyprenyl-3-methyl-5-hydroxy-6-metoxy-1,4-benzoquinol methylase
LTTLFIPSVRKNNGSGHIKRSLILAEQLTSSGETCLFYLSLSQSDKADFIERFPLLQNYSLYLEKSSLPSGIDRIILDNRETSRSEWESWENLAPVLLIDEGGEARRYGSYLIDTLPVMALGEANVLGSPLFKKGEPRRLVIKEDPSILVSFGGEDPAGLTEPVVKELLRLKGESDSSLAVVQGPMARDFDLPSGVTLYKSPDRLDDLFEEYDLVITSFGLTPYEAERAGVPVLLVNPTSYHEKASLKEHFLSAGVGSRGIRRLGQSLCKITGSREGHEARTRHRVEDLLAKIGTAPRAICPLCGRKSNPAVERFEDRTFYYCKSCRNYYLVNWNREEEAYDREYFFSRYKAQYGKTYLEDFDSIKSVGKGRLAEIGKVLSPKGGKGLLTDLGCAFGPFLAAAGEEGYDCRGVDINEDGAQWIEQNLGIPVIRGSLDNEMVMQQLKEAPGEVTTLWYVIEHISDQILLLKNLNKTLKKRGVLAFGTPSGRGVSARKNLSSFLELSPPDHYVIYTPRGARKVLARHGFRTVKVKSVGHHPERFGSWVGKKGSFTYNGLMLMSRCFSLGDSLEVYAVKTAE